MPRIPDDQRAAILDDIRAGLPRNEIARKHHRSAGTVTNIAEENGLTDAFDRSATLHATRARAVDLADLRSRLAQRTYLRAHKILDRLDKPTFETKIATVTGDVVTITADDPSPRDERDLASAISSYTAAADRVTDATDSSSAAKSLLGGLGDALKIAAERLDDEPEPADEPPVA